MADRIELIHITFIGSTVTPASVEFGPRATVICGPSDTGKSFIARAIDFMLGGSKPPNNISEVEGYSVAMLGLKLPSGEAVTLSRPVSGGDFCVYKGDMRELPTANPWKTLKAKQQPKGGDSLSLFLLKALGLEGKRIRRNARNETNALSFRNLVHLCVIDESSMQDDRPPALTSVHSSHTSDLSTLKLLLQGEDDSSLVPVSSKNEQKQAAAVRAEVLDQLIAELRQQLEGAPSFAELRHQQEQLGEEVRRYTESISRVTAERAELTTRIAQLEREAAGVAQRLADIGALTARFRLLGRQYRSDLARLEMIAEAGSLLGYFNPGKCVFCGADVEHQHYNADCAQDTTAFRDSVSAEQNKTAALNADLNDELADLAAEQARLTEEIKSIGDAIANARKRLADYDAELAPFQGALKDLLDARSDVEQNLGLYEQIARIETRKEEFLSEPVAKAAAVAAMQLSAVSSFSRQIAARLAAWGVPGADETRYDRSEQDIISGNEVRAAHGKGVRAILHAAFTLGLAQYCFEGELPHPGFVVLDSPLVTYRPPDKGGDLDSPIPTNVIGQFYADIQHGVDVQVIVLENTEPPDELDSDSVSVHFSANESSGRYGFFPLGSKSKGAK